MSTGKERGFINLLNYVESQGSGGGGSVQELKEAIQKIWDTLSTDWQQNGGAHPDVKTQLENLALALSKYQPIDVTAETKAKLARVGIYSTKVEDILYDLANNTTTGYVTVADFNTFKSAVGGTLDGINRTIPTLQSQTLGTEATAATGETTVEGALIALAKGKTTKWITDEDVDDLFVTCTDKSTNPHHIKEE